MAYWIAATTVLLFLITFRKLFKRRHLHWRGRHVLITGGSSGLGLALALYAAGRGARVTVVARDQARLDEAVQRCRAQATQDDFVRGRCADVTDPKAIRQAIWDACDEHGDLEYVFFCAGHCIPGMFRHASLDDFQSMMNTNYFGTVNTLQCALKSKSTTNPCRMVAVTSVCAVTTFAGFAAYSPSKAAVRSLWDTMRNEYCANAKLQWHVYCPSTIDSPGLVQENASKPQVTKVLEEGGGTFSPEVAARHLVEGMERGEYMITQGPIEFCLRALAHGTAPRTRPLLEFLIMPWLVLLGAYVYRHYDRGVRRAGEHVSVARRVG